ncbi:hypothetical protein ACHMW6_14275 [Pseudoduganella sp. UC29_106]|uniref:hypothetical protein n=1 Tax=Pseudoduganella sp. UC29_106 TaxID=3374553 RepID=UPI0037580CF7
MRLPGTRYQEHGWEHVRKLLGACSLEAFQQCDLHQALDSGRHADLLDSYTDAMVHALRPMARRLRGEAAGNSYGDSVAELSLALLFELQAQPSFWGGFMSAVAAEHARCGAFWSTEAGDGMLRKKVNDMFVVLRDKVDSDNYQAATGRDCSPNRIYTYRMLDTAYREIEHLFANWERNAEQVGAILGRELAGYPIEVRQMASISGCRAEWIIRWSETLERFSRAPGPLHTKSKRFASLKNSPDKIAEMLTEIGDYEELSSNQDCDWQQDAEDASLWLEDYWRVVEDSKEEVSPSLSYDKPQQDALLLLQGEPLAVRLAVFQKLLGPADDSYPDEWLDAATGELPAMQQLAAMGGMSVPTLRKRRNETIDRLYGRGK